MPACSVIWCGIRKTPNRPSLTMHRIPRNECKKKKWLEAIGMEHIKPNVKDIFICSLHFDDKCINKTLDVTRLRDDAVPFKFGTLPNDIDNYTQYHIMGTVPQFRMKPGCLPTRFECQPDRMKRMSNTTTRPYILKKQRKALVAQCEEDFENKERPEPSSDTSVFNVIGEQFKGAHKTAEKSKQVHETHEFRRGIPSETQPLPNDMLNYTEYHIMGKVSQVRMKTDCFPSKFECQEDRKRGKNLKEAHKTAERSKRVHKALELRRAKQSEIKLDSINESPMTAHQDGRTTPSEKELPKFQGVDYYKNQILLNIEEDNSCDSVGTKSTAGEDWVPRGDVCRCCVSRIGVWDLTATYVEHEDQREIFHEMLADCYGIKLSNISDFGPSRLICDSCATSLREANKFKNQVLLAEERFTAYYGKDEIEIKEEYLNDSFESQEFEDTGQHLPIKIEGDSLEAAPYTISEPQEISKPSSSNLKKSQQKNKPGIRLLSPFDSESDDESPEKTSVPQETKKHSEKEFSDCIVNDDVCIEEIIQEECGEEIKMQASFGNGDELEQIDEKKLTGSTAHKTEVKETKKRRLTCNTVLSYTTACPFIHHKSWFQCFYCKLDFMEFNMLREHTVKTHLNPNLNNIKRLPRSLQIDITEFQCKICNVDLNNMKNMVKHFSEAHNKVVYDDCITDFKVNSSPFSCHLCGKEFHVFRTLTIHMNVHYANCICDICGKPFINNRRLKLHKRTHDIGHFPCGKCGKVLNTMNSKMNHMESHIQRVIKCNICEKTMKHYNERIKHMSEVHNITYKFKCHICGREYSIKHYLAAHMRRVHTHMNAKCEECGMGFITNHGLKKHVTLMHKGLKAFPCTVCNKNFAQSCRLKEHTRIHDTDKVSK